jgi:methionine-S-sulfoxide reductase
VRFPLPGQVMVTPERALPGRPERPYRVPERHAVLGTPLEGPWPAGTEEISLGLGCFWGAEKALWQLPGVHSTAVGYQGGFTPNPTYEEVCTSLTGHAEVVRVVLDPERLPVTRLLRTFWELHDPTQGYRQGNDVGTQYRSAIYWTTPEQHEAALATREVYAAALSRAGFGAVTTEIRPAAEAGPFYLAESHHQQYLHKVPGGYCPVHSTGVACPVPEGA